MMCPYRNPHLRWRETCPCRKSDPTVFMMESAEDGLCNDVTKPVDRTRKRRVLSQSEMRPDMVVIGSISLENLTQVGLAKDHDVIQAFSTDRANQPLGMPILPGCARRNRVIPDAHRRNAPLEGTTVAGVAVADQMGRRLVPRKGLGNLARDPLRRRMVGHAQQDQTPSFMPQDHQDKQQPKVDCRDYKEVHGPDPRRMVTQERLPCLARSGSTLGHVLGNRRLSDLDPELQQFTMNTRRAPERVLHAQPPDQAAHLNRNSGPAAARTRLPSPIKPKARPMPTQRSVRLDDRDGAPQRRKQPPQPDKKQPVSGRQPGLRGSLSTKHVQLMP